MIRLLNQVSNFTVFLPVGAVSAVLPGYERKEIRCSLFHAPQAADCDRSASPAGTIPGPPGWPAPTAPYLASRPRHCPGIGSLG